AVASNAAAATSAPPATITGNLNLNNANRTVTLVNHATANTFTSSVIGIIGSDDLRIDAAIDAGGTTGALTVQGSGRLALTNSNIFTGTGNVLVVNSATAILT